MDGTNLKRVTIFAGHYGSGKTNVAINYAIKLAGEGKKVAIADLDIVNPYFRTKDSEATLKEHAVRLISSPYANTNVDTPALPAQAYAVTQDKDSYAVIDVGGDDRGALALGRYAPSIKAENNYEMFFVINMYRYLTCDAESTVSVMREIENASSLKFTGIVNNSNLGAETTEDTVISSQDYAKEVSRLAGLDIKFTTAERKHFEMLQDKIDNLLPIDVFVKQSWSK